MAKIDITEEQKKLLKNYKEVSFEELKDVISDACKKQLEGTPAKPILVWGAPGTGKSAAMDAVVAHDDVEKECGIRRFIEHLNLERCSFDADAIKYKGSCVEDSYNDGKYRILEINLSTVDTPSVFQQALDFAKTRKYDGGVLSNDWLALFSAWLPLYTIPSDDEAISQYNKVLEGFEQYVYVPDYGEWKNFMLSQNFDRTLLDIMFRFIEQEDVFGGNSYWIRYDERPCVIDEKTLTKTYNMGSYITPRIWKDFAKETMVYLKDDKKTLREYFMSDEAKFADLHGVREAFVSFARNIVEEYKN